MSFNNLIRLQYDAGASGALVGGIIAAAGATAGAGMSSAASGKMNKRTLNWNREQYAKERADGIMNWHLQSAQNEHLWNKQNAYDTEMWHRQNAREDMLWHRQNAHDINMWNKQNEYNSPAAQMERYKEAGLNPYLIYGQNNMGGTISTGSGGSGSQTGGGKVAPSDIKQARSHSWNPSATQFDFHSGIMALAAFREQAARTDNLGKQNQVLEEEAGLKAAQTASTIAQTAQSTWDLALKKRLEHISVEAAEESLRAMKIKTDLSLTAEQRAILTHSSNLREAAVRIAATQQETLNKKQLHELTKLDLELREMGIHPDSPAWIKAGAHFINQNKKGWKPKFEDLGSSYLKKLKWKD